MPMIIDSIPKKEKDIISFINQYYTLNLSSYLNDIQVLRNTPEGSIALSKVYFSIQDYKSAIELIKKNRECFINDNSFFYKRMMYHIFSDYQSNKELINELIKSNQSDDDHLYLREKDTSVGKIEDEETDIFKKADLFLQNNEYRKFYDFVGEYKYPTSYQLIYYAYECYPSIRHELIEYFKENEKHVKLLDTDFYKSLNLKLLLKNNKTDFNVLKSLNKYNNKINAMLMNAIFNAGTSNDSVYRETKTILEVSGWNKFIGLGLVGMIHSNYLGDPYTLLKEFLPSDVDLKNGGALYSLGFIRQHFNEDKEFLSNFVTDDVLKGELVFGALLSLGLICSGGNVNENYHVTKIIMDKIGKIHTHELNDAMVKEGGLLSLGMTNLGTCNKKVISFLEKYSDDDHDRIKRNAGISLSLVHMGSKNRDVLRLLDDECPIERYCATLTVGSAFHGTGDLEILGKLLPFCSDVDEDVRRGAVFSIGMICCEDDEVLMDLLLLIGMNHCPRVRGSVALTLGMFLSGKSAIYKNHQNYNKVVDLLEVMLYDSNNLVVQQSCIGLGMLMCQSNSHFIKNYKRILEKINSLCLERDDNSGIKMGACIGRSFIGLAGECGVISVLNSFGKTDHIKLMGLVFFFNYWFSYQFLPFISLSVKYNGIFVLDEQLNLVPKQFNIYEKRSKFETELVKVPEKRSRRFKKKEVKLEYVVEEEDNYIIENGDKMSYGEMIYLGFDKTGIFFE